MEFLPVVYGRLICEHAKGLRGQKSGYNQKLELFEGLPNIHLPRDRGALQVACRSVEKAYYQKRPWVMTPSTST